jgi:cytochrome c oxidase assembly protein subunit 15
MLAYLIWILAMLHAADALRLPRGDRGRTLALIVAALVTVQAGIGIATLLLVVPLDLAITHQAMAVVVLTVAVIHAERLRHRVERRPLDAPAGAVEQPT